MLRPYALLHTLSFPTYPSVGSHLLVFTLMFSAISVTYSPPCFPRLLLFSPSENNVLLLWRLLTSHYSLLLRIYSLVRPPRVRMITFHSCHCLIYCRRFVQYWTLLCCASSSLSSQPYMRFLFVSASVCVRLPSDSTSQWTPLPFTNSSYCQACSGLSPPSYHPCRAHTKKEADSHQLLFLFILLSVEKQLFHKVLILN